ncbi:MULTISPECIES: aminoacyl-tRNA hydrolase [Coprobacillaceae]|uniref:aminoacyl-tRNA hydrolase n=1 Tax=Coprobacillaceae TaxID=2810280 RepID=UPI000E4B4D44|nr:MULTISPECIES: aminoacyl-tRNA hydrolase [Coprobacillaceae]RHM60853.1 aminoacyl-tRNA hydrolase [Coprobacillus sp. AF33-1AC]
MKLIIGLGNPGNQYQGTRHNVGFMVLDQLANKWNVNINQDKFKGLYVKTNYQGEAVILLKPQTYMNLSGESVRQVMDFYKIEREDIIVIYDDLDMPVGKLRLREKGSAGGHNGIKSIISHVGGQDFKRIRVGIERSKVIPVVDYVLGKFTKEQKPFIDQGIHQAVEAIEDCLEHDFHHAMNQFN